MFNLPWRYQLMIAVLSIAAYAPTLQTGFLWDDHVVIEINPAIRQWSLQNLKHDFTTDEFNQQGDPYYRPLVAVMNRLDYTLWGLRPLGYHVTNVAIHLGNALLIAELVIALGCLPLTAFLTGSLFAVHPIGVEQLMIVAGRAELMGLFFPLLTLLLFLKDSKPALAWGWVAYLAALLSKESAVVTPFLLALVTYVRQEPLTKYKRIVPMVLVLPFYLWLRHSIVGPMIAHPDAWLTVRFFFQEFPQVVVRYLALLLVPWNLHSHRLLPHISHFWALQLFAFCAACFLLIKRYHRLAAFSLGWFLLTLLPKTPVMIYGNFMLDHWVYPSALALFLPLAQGVTLGWLERREWIRSLAAFGYFSVLIAWALLVHLNVTLRGTDEKMYRWALHFTTSNPVKYNLAVVLLQTGRPLEAIGYLEEVREYYPEDSKTINALALAFWKLDKRWMAIHLLENYAKQYPKDAETFRHLKILKASSKKK